MQKVLYIGIFGDSIFLNVNKLPKPGETIQTNDCFHEFGGKGFNQAYMTKRLGGDVTFISSIGNDDLGQELIEKIKEKEVNHIYIKKDKNTCFGVILTEQSAENEVIVYSGATLDESDFKTIKGEIDKSDIISLQLEINYNLIEQIVKYAKEQGKTVILNASPIMDISSIINLIDLFVVNTVEAIAIFGEKFKDTILEKKLNVIVTSSIGATYISSEIKEYKTIKVNVKDTVGAGDVFLGTLNYYISIGTQIEDAIPIALEYASKSVEIEHVLNAIDKIIS